MKKIAFLFLMHEPHVYHLASIAFELSMKNGLEVHVFGNPKSMILFNQIAKSFPNHNCQIEIWKSRSVQSAVESIKGKKLPNVKMLLKRHKKRLLSFDMVLSTDFYTDWLCKSKTGNLPLFVFGFHGAGDGSYGFTDNLKLYDYLLISGSKISSRLKEKGILTPDNGLEVGYPKFDLTLKKASRVFFENNKPVVLYNPHFQSDKSSYYKWGQEILEYFYNQKQFNLIFAPHYNLFRGLKSSVQVPNISEKYFNASNILIDKGSDLSNDMTYTINSDLYLGDVSSQVYEFLYTPRPCMFLNSQGLEWENNPNCKHWTFGPTLNDMAIFDEVLKEAFNTHDCYVQTQIQGFNSTFSRTKDSAGKRAAIALNEILNQMDK
jgi:hypothetical protein